MTACSACEVPAEVQVQGYSLCHTHGRGMMLAVLTGDHTPVGYIVAAACGLDAEPLVVKVSAPETTAHRSAFMRHGALAQAEPSASASPRSDKPQPLRAQAFS